MIRMIPFTSLVVLAAQAPIPAPAEDPITALPGTYYCHGTDAEGSGYRGMVRIGKHGEVYYVRWTFPSGPPAVGIGIVNGDAFAVSYYGRTVGVVLYEIDGSRLVGRWTDVATPGRLFEETLTRIADEALDDEQPTSHPPGLRI